MEPAFSPSLIFVVIGREKSSERFLPCNTFEALLLRFSTCRGALSHHGFDSVKICSLFLSCFGKNNHVWMISGAKFNISCICDRIIGRVVKQTEDIIMTNNLVIIVNQMFVLLILVFFISVLYCTCYRCHSLTETDIIRRVYPGFVPCSTLHVRSCYQNMQMVFMRIRMENHRSCSLHNG